MSLFEDLADLARGAVETVHGKAVRIVPMARALGPNGSASPDASRPAFDTTACFYEDSTLQSSSDTQPLVGESRRLMHMSPIIQASIRLPASPAIRTDDLMQRLDDGQWFIIGPMKPDGLGGVAAELSRTKGLAQ